MSNKNPNGWVLATASTNLVQMPDWLDKKTLSWLMYAAHVVQVEVLPAGTTLMCQNDDCSIGGFFKESLLFATQYHPEMTPEFIAALVNELESIVDQRVFDNAKKSINQKSDRSLFASWIVRFYEFSIREELN